MRHQSCPGYTDAALIQMKTVLITGATGFVGNQIINSLLNMNCKIKMILRSHKIARQLNIKNTENIEICVLNDLFLTKDDEIRKVVHGVDTIIHCAWYVDPIDYLSSTQNLTCLTGSLNLAKVAAESGVSRFVGIGTCFEYDLTNGYVNVGSLLNPNSLYASTKASLYLTLKNFLSYSKVDFLWLRLFFLYGYNENLNRLNAYLRERFKKGEQAILKNPTLIRDYLDVEDAGFRIAKATLEKPPGVYNVCSGCGITLRDFAEKIAAEYDSNDLLLIQPDELSNGIPKIIVGTDPISF
jgi:nucleoside-diphosphate-sugar epimerase